MELRKECANAIRALTMDAIDKSKSGHPGAPMGMANMAEALWRFAYKHNPKNPRWFNRDRFVLSNGHASMLLYSLLHLTGYDLSMDDIKNFRRLHSKTPGHPEIEKTAGIDIGTGPLGQGIATAVGMALAEKLLAKKFNRENHAVIDHKTWVFLGDGCLMEGVAQEAISLAGTWKLNKLIALYDSNAISIDGDIKNWFTEDVAKRFEASNWHVIKDIDGHNPEELDKALAAAQAVSDKPVLIICKTVIGYGSPHKAGKSSCHGSPMGAEENEATKQALGWKYAPFEIPQHLYGAWNCVEKGKKANDEWDKAFQEYAKAYPELAKELSRRIKGEFPPEYSEAFEKLFTDLLNAQEDIATRVAGKKVLDAIAQSLPELLGGSADLTGSVGTLHANSKDLDLESFEGNYIHYGVREFAMSTVMNGLSLHGGFIPYGGTFLVFSDYAKNAIRLAALSKIRGIWVLTHDSIGVGEDGPTHQPIEHVSALRLTPNVDVWRPCDTIESAVAWKAGIEKKDGPTCLAMSRQNLKAQAHTKAQLADIAKGAYILSDSEKTPEIILIATGSEVGLAVEGAKALKEQGKQVRVVSMPCSDVFDRQDSAYKEKVLPKTIRKRIALEAGSADFWYKYVGLDGKIIGMTSFRESAPANQLFAYYGFGLDNLLAKAKELLGE